MENTALNPILEIQAVTKRFGNVVALNGVSLQVERGSIFALLGSNGAGKSTLVKSILSLLQVTSGNIFIEGKRHTQWNARERVAYLPDRFEFYPYYTVESAMKFFAELAGLQGKEKAEKIDKAVQMTGIYSLRGRKVKTLSKGQNRRLGLASLFLSNAHLFFLDEPFEGLDPIGFKDLKEIMRSLREEGKTIFLNSHLLSDVQSIADHLALLHEGNIIVQGRTEDLLQKENLEEFFYRAVGGKSSDKG